MKKHLILKIITASILAVTLAACGKEQETPVPTELLSEDIPHEFEASKIEIFKLAMD